MALTNDTGVSALLPPLPARLPVHVLLNGEAYEASGAEVRTPESNPCVPNLCAPNLCVPYHASRVAAARIERR